MEPRPASAIAWVTFPAVGFFFSRIAASGVTKPLRWTPNVQQPVPLSKL
jgi:hypothetical protein